jgi:hypothetical protein
MSKFTFGSVILLILVSFLTGCGVGSVEPDYTTQEFEKALNEGVNVDGKTVLVEVLDFKPNSKLGANIHAGEHLNFISLENPGVKAGDEVMVKVKKTGNLLGSFIIDYEIVD